MPELEDLDTLDVDAACHHFNTCYKDPADFTICLTGQVEVYHCSFVHRLHDAAVCQVWTKHNLPDWTTRGIPLFFCASFA